MGVGEVEKRERERENVSEVNGDKKIHGEGEEDRNRKCGRK